MEGFGEVLLLLGQAGPPLPYISETVQILAAIANVILALSGALAAALALWQAFKARVEVRQVHDCLNRQAEEIKADIATKACKYRNEKSPVA